VKAYLSEEANPLKNENVKLKNPAWLEYTHSFCSFHFTIITFHFFSHDQVDIGC